MDKKADLSINVVIVAVLALLVLLVLSLVFVGKMKEFVIADDVADKQTKCFVNKYMDVRYEMTDSDDVYYQTIDYHDVCFTGTCSIPEYYSFANTTYLNSFVAYVDVYEVCEIIGED